MINAPQLLSDLTRLLKRLEDDLRQRIEEISELKASLQVEWQAARDADRCSETFETWVDQVITQAGVHWLLSCVFLRFIEDNQLVDRPWLGGTPESGRLALVRDRHEAYFQANPHESDREYLLAAFREARTLPGLRTFFDQEHNPTLRLGVSGDAAMVLRQFWQQVDPNTGALQHDFTDETWNTRFLGDLYQDLSEATRKRYALLQTPEFVEEFILDRTLTPAIREFGYSTATLIDPTCGSGHFLLGAFYRFVDEWQRAEPSRNRRDIAQKALDAVAGVDLNPFAIAISRFRLLVAALLASDVRKLIEAPDFRIHLAIGDSLLHGKRFGLTATEGMFESAEDYAVTGLAHAYASEDLADVQRILGRQYHAVVGNPPYIVVKDAALSAAYRQRYVSCHRQYSLGVPFTERFFDIAKSGSYSEPSGFVGLITANSFMKREFGSQLIEKFLPQVDLTHVVDTSGAYIPGHGTPTTILFGRNRKPVSNTVRVVMGLKGEPAAPKNPSQGLVWQSIRDHIDLPHSSSVFVSVADLSRKSLSTHPWMLGGDAIISLLELINSKKDRTLKELHPKIGAVALTRFDDAFVLSAATIRRIGLSNDRAREYITGEDIRDWSVNCQFEAIWPYEADGSSIKDSTKIEHALWPFRSQLKIRVAFGKSQVARGLPWFEYSMLFQDRFNVNDALSFSNVSTHNHFSHVKGHRIFNAHAPIITVAEGANNPDIYYLLSGLLNSSLACLWMKQVFYPKGGDHMGSEGARVSVHPWEDRYEFSGTGLADFPLAKESPIELAQELESLNRRQLALQPRFIIGEDSAIAPTRLSLDASRVEAAIIRRKMIALQEELDWQCYGHYGILSDSPRSLNPPEVNIGERAFEILLARRMEAGREHTNWFERHGSKPMTEIPNRWPEGYRQVVQSRIELIERDERIGLLERPEYKRRWNTPKWEELEQTALRNWLLARLESKSLWVASPEQPPQINTTNRLADAMLRDAEFMETAALYAGHADFALAQLVDELVAAEAVPALPVQRYAEAGLRKRAQWQSNWALQRQEDYIDDQVVSENSESWREEFTSDARQRFRIAADQPLTNEAQIWIGQQLTAEIKRHQDERKANEVGPIPVPPKYQSKDFLKTDFWRLRGGLDVPKERWISYPGCERGSDGSLVIAWAGWNHLQQATALAGYYMDMKDNEGWEPARLQPLLASQLELLPWLEQWHNELDPVYGERMGDYYRGFVTEEARALGFTLDDLRAWKPVATAAKRGRKKKETT